MIKDRIARHICFIIVLFLMIGVISTSGGLVWAGETESIISLREEYTDNLYLNPNIRDDFISTLEAGVKFFPTSGKKRFEEENRGIKGEYKGKLIHHKNYSREDRTEHSGDIHAKFGFGKRDTFSVKLNEGKYYERVDVRRADAPENLTQKRSTTIAPAFSLLLTGGKLDIGYQYIEKKYEDPAFTDNYGWKGSLQLNKEMGLKTSTVLGYTYLARNYNEGRAEDSKFPDNYEWKGFGQLNRKMGFGTSAVLGYTYIGRRYSEDVGTDPDLIDRDPEFTDNDEWKGSLQLDKKMGRRSSVLVGYSYLSRNYERVSKDFGAKDYRDQGGDIGLKLEIPPDMKGQIKYGYVERKYEQEGPAGYYTLEANAEKAMGRRILAKFSYKTSKYEEVEEYFYRSDRKYRRWKAEVKMNLMKGHVVAGNYEKAIRQDLYGLVYERSKGNIGMSHEFYKGIKLAYSVYNIRDKYEEESRKDSSLGGKASLKIPFTKRTSLSLSGDYEKKDYEDKAAYGPDGRQDEYGKGAVGLSYKILDWLSSSLTYTYIDNRSTELEEEYTNNRYAIEIKGTF